MHPHLPYWLASLYLPNIGAQKLKRWLMHFSTIQTLLTASQDEWSEIGISPSEQQTLRIPNWQQVEKDLAWASQPNHHLICIDDVDYPALLKETADPPRVLFVRGNFALLSDKQMAMVGARRASAGGVQNAEYFAQCFVEAGLVVTSGLALGIDAASHRGALSIHGPTIGVAGTGLLHVYPSQHAALYEEIVEKNGALVSEFPLASRAHAAHFPRRNRIICGLSMGVLVVEAALKSGSLITARLAIEEGREVFAIPGSIHQPMARGCHYLIKQGAKLVESAEDIFEELTGLRLYKNQPNSAPKEDLSANLDEKQLQILQQIEYDVTPLDVIILRTRLTVAEVSSILLSLELCGCVQSVPGGYTRMASI